jgi:N-methylhydantoinase A
MAPPRLQHRIGIDTGGTFTDCVMVDRATGEVRVAKVPSQPAAPQAPALEGVGHLGTPEGLRTVDSVTHGTTIATNAIITGDLARVGLITTRGFRDVLEVGTQQRPKLYDLRQRPRPALVPRDLRIEVGGRLDAAGDELEPVDPSDVLAAVEQLLDAGVEGIAVACLFSFANPEHERLIQRVVTERADGVYVGRSSAISQEPREYPRFATAAVNASLAPRLDPYLRGLEVTLGESLPDARLFVMQSNGGVGTVDRSVGEAAHQLVLSGPAAGVIGGARAAAAAGYSDCVTFDVGGTSADVGVVAAGEPRNRTEMTLPNGVPCNVPHIEVVTIGAGGGSIAAVDAGGALSVGPRSAGADPGPAAYGRGGREPTVTDAHLVLGRLAPQGLIGGRLPLDTELARSALSGVAAALGVELERAALGVLAVLEENMAGAIRRAAATAGDDLRDFVLVAGGGAGPLHAAALIRTLGMPAAVVPPHPGLLSALGLLGSHIRHDRVAPLLALTERLADAVVEEAFARLETEATSELEVDGVAEPDRRLERSLDIRYLGQEHALRVPVSPGEGAAAAAARFHELHERTFGHAAPEVATEVVAARSVGLGLRPLTTLRPPPSTGDGRPVGARTAIFDAEQGPVQTAVYVRSHLTADQTVEGPAIVEQLDSTTVVPPDCRAGVHSSGALILTLGGTA